MKTHKVLRSVQPAASRTPWMPCRWCSDLLTCDKATQLKAPLSASVPISSSLPSRTKRTLSSIAGTGAVGRSSSIPSQSGLDFRGRGAARGSRRQRGHFAGACSTGAGLATGEELFQSQDVFEGVVTGFNRGGVIVRVGAAWLCPSFAAFRSMAGSRMGKVTRSSDGPG
jgi:hypothetical protein